MNPLNIAVIDFETTGLTPPVCAVEFAYVRINEQMEVLDEYVTLVNPGRAIEPGAIGVHGITEEDVAGAIPIEQAIAPLQDLPCVLIAHNLPFDLRIAGPHLDVVGEVCTLALSRQYVTGAFNHKLTTIRDHLGLPDFAAHRALGDAHTSLNILRRILNDHGLTLDQVIKRQSKPRMLAVMPFGKYGGRPVVDVPRDYRQWLLNAGNLDKDLEYTLRKLESL